MDVKKSPKASLEDKKSIYLLMGFVAVLSLLYIGFEWTQHEVTIYESTTTEVIEEEEIEIIQTAEVLPPPPPPDVPEVIEILNVVEDDVETAEIEIDTEDEKDKVVVIQAPVSTSGTAVEEDTEVVFVVVESMPSFPGGDPALFKYLNDNIKYPVIAQESGIQGRVICQFVVNRDGSIVDIEVVRSVDKSLDAEAIRVIKNMPRWTPGKQRGKTVRVKYTLPVNFRLQ
ncbi:MAG: energy transducer TonB [Bacteroidales bacterium]|nr:energy transducer TonB [Bacteroidales bacterium]ODT53019.1 MAG: energy transducer TonB [Paludibacter sp. SCN 50-10]ODU58911.1 MAG: energy transducer TonB [Paludibacter sp. SCN 51-9]OJX87817.1 MAG: energy transducer TonB [Paludibacter sp. 47-17]